MVSESDLQLIVLTRNHTERVRATSAEIIAFLSQQAGVHIATTHVDLDVELEKGDADLVIVLGGDGAILRACRCLGDGQLPILGVNLGRLGFLADLSPDEFRESFHLIRQRQFRVVEHLMFQCCLRHADGETQTHLGLNEIAISAAAALEMLEVDLEINGEPVMTYSCDGMIISTPVGSTAHSLSAGGPILRQDLEAFVITPICPHTLTNRPLVDHADSVFALKLVAAPSGAVLVVDGQIRLPIAIGDTIEVRRAPVALKLAKIPGHSYYGTLQKKLGWTGQPHYPNRKR